jgi:hypothetical protein
VLNDVRRTLVRLLECNFPNTPVLNQRAALTNGGETQDGTQPKENYMDPSQGAAYRFAPFVEQQETSQPETAAVAIVEAAPLDGEVLSERPPVVPAFPIGLIDFNLPIVVVSNDHNEDAYDNAQIITVLKGSLHPVVITFWEHGEQKVEQFDTDGDSVSGDYKVEQDQPYPRTLYVVIGREGRNLVLDPELYASEEAARDESTLDDIANVYPVVVEAPAPTLADDVAGADSHVGGEKDEGSLIESEEEDDDLEGTEALAPTADEAPTEMYVAGRNRRVGETVHAFRKGFGVRICTIQKLRRDAHKSLYINANDGTESYWARNVNIRY